VGFADPYPDDDIYIEGSVDDVPPNFKTPENVRKHVYPCARYKKDNSPNCVYLPCKEIMLKMMRACIKVKKPKNLWIMKKGVWGALAAKAAITGKEDSGMEDSD